MATAAPQPRAAAIDDIDYVDLYTRWERGNWSAMAIDFTQDKIDWEERLTADQRRGAAWFYSLFFHGEDAVTDGLSPYIEAAPLEEQKYFLATQQVDEARHAIFFKRFFHEVAGMGDGSLAGGMAATDAQLTWGHRKVFAYLEEMAHTLHHDQSPAQFARALTLYHVLIEGTLAQPGQHMIEAFLEREDVMPGFRAGIRNVALDEQRHIAFGVRALADLYAANPAETEAAIADVIRIVGPWSTAVAKPPEWDESYITCFGSTSEELSEEGLRALETRLRAIGLDIAAIPRFPLSMDLPFEQRAQIGRRMLKANLIGPDRPASRAPDDVALLFDQLRRTVNADAARTGTVIEWAFTDAEPWHLRIANGSTSVQPGAAPKADLSLRISYDDWVDLFAQRVDARRLLLQRRLRPKGDPRVFLRLGRIFGT
jgi:ribonucleotide reductase beta subunit family protein with ferritin-like domain